MVEKTKQKIDAAGLEEGQFTSLLTTAKSLFSDCSKTWPLHHSFHYLGHIPKLDAHVESDIFGSRLKCGRFTHNIYGDWHMSSIRLASWIWGKLQKEMVKRRSVAFEKWHEIIIPISYFILVRQGLFQTLSWVTLWWRWISYCKHCRQHSLNLNALFPFEPKS